VEVIMWINVLNLTGLLNVRTPIVAIPIMQRIISTFCTDARACLTVNMCEILNFDSSWTLRLVFHV